MSKRIFFLIASLAIFAFAGIFLIKKEKPKPLKLSGALEGMQLMAAQRAYPDNFVADSKYFEAFEKYQLENEIELREDTEPWMSLGPHNTGGRTLALAFNPQNPNTIYAGSASGGLWRSYNMGKGTSWEYVNTGFPVLGISSIAFAPNDSTQIYLGTGEVYNHKNAGTGAAFRSTRGTYGIGILKSEDGGITWENSLDWSLANQRGVNEIKVAQSDPNIVYAATTEGVFKSINGGGKWDISHNVIMATDLVIHPENPEIVIVGCGNFGSSNKGIYKTTDGGDNWNKSGSPVPSNFQGKIQIDMAPSDPNYVYASIGNGFGGSDGASWLLRSTDIGDSWQLMNTTDYSKWQGWFAHDVAVNPVDKNDLTIIGIDIWKSFDGGDSIRQVTEGGIVFGTTPVGMPESETTNFSHSDHHVAVYHPENSNIILFGNDGGVNLSTDNGISFQTINGGYQTSQFYNGFSVSQTDGDFAMGGLQDNSTVIYSGTKAWSRNVGGDGSWTAINPTNDSILFASAQFLFLARSLDRGESFSFGVSVPGQSQPTAFIAPYVMAPSDPKTIYAARSKVYKSTNNADDFVPTNNNMVLNEDPVFCMAVSPLNSDVVIAATAPLIHDRALFITTDGGDTWENISPGLPFRFPTDVCFAPDEEGTAYVTFGGFTGSHVYRTTNYGDSWTNINANLPDVPTSAIAVDPEASHHLYVGNDLGVFVSTDAGGTWEPYNKGLFDAVIVMDLKIMESDRKIFVATHGNGSFRRDLLEVTSSNTEVDLLATELILYPNPAEEFINIEFVTETIQDLSVSIFDMGGRKLVEKTIKSNQGENDYQINVGGLIPGNYSLTIASDRTQQTVKFVKI